MLTATPGGREKARFVRGKSSLGESKHEALAGRFQKEIDQKTNDFNSSISFDSRMAREDIEGSIAHATMLGACGDD